MLIKYNVLAGAGAALGFANSILTWKLLGAGVMADAWLLAWAISLALAVLVLAGVEQFLVFYSEKLIQSREQAGEFLFLSLAWSVLSGVFFALIFAAFAPLLVSLFASGFQDQQKSQAVQLLLWLLPQAAVTPLLHVVRAALSAHGRYGVSYVLSLIVPFMLLLALSGLLLTGNGNARLLAQTVFSASILQLALALWLVRNLYRCSRRHDFKYFADFVQNSMAVRLGHSLHNFFVNLIMNSVISMQGAGNVSAFQYAKRFADGVAMVTIGPQSGIYHARQARAWAEQNLADFMCNIRVFLKNCLPLLVLLGVTVWWAMPHVFSVFSKSATTVSFAVIAEIYVYLVIWQGLIAIESVSAGVVVTARKSRILWLVNALFVLVFYGYTQLISNASSVSAVPVMAIYAQLGSFVLYTIFAWRLAGRRFGRVNE